MTVIKPSQGERIFNVFNISFILLLMLVTIYPFLHVTFASVSDPYRLGVHDGILLAPLGFTLKGYQMVLRNPNILTGYMNTIFYVSVGTAVNLIMTSLAAYILSRKKLYVRNLFMIIVIITMYFNGGLIPRYLIIRNIGLINSRLALILPVAINTYNMIIMRTNFQAIPESLEESVKVDGAHDFTILFRIVLPLSMPVIAVMILYYGVAHWNSWFDAMIFLKDRAKYPLQLFLREILIDSNTENMMESMEEMSEEVIFQSLTRYCTILIASLPVLMLYPFLQKYFVKGVMIGALKG